MLQLDPAIVAERLRTDVPQFVTVGLARDLGAVKPATLRYPSAFVILLGETSGTVRYQMADVIEQAVEARIGVVMAVRDIADRIGTRAGQDLRSIREAVLMSVCRFVPEPDGNAFRFSRGALQSGIGGDGQMFWQDDFTLRFDRRIQLT